MLDESVDFEAVVPIIPAVSDMSAALAFYTRRLGFATNATGDPADMAVVHRGAVHLILQKSDDSNWVSQTTIRIRARDLEAMYAEMRDAGMGNVCKMTGFLYHSPGVHGNSMSSSHLAYASIFTNARQPRIALATRASFRYESQMPEEPAQALP